jgi:hypothetical protein
MKHTYKIYARTGDEKWKELASGKQRSLRIALAIVKELRKSWAFSEHEFKIDKCQTVRAFLPEGKKS